MNASAPRVDFARVNDAALAALPRLLAYFLGWLEELGRDGGVKFVHRSEKLGLEENGPRVREIGRVLGLEIHEASQSAVSVTKVNVSLAIRKAFDRLAEHRAKAGSRLRAAE